MSVAVTCVSDNPVAVNDTATKGEDSGATAISVLTNDTDVDGGTKIVQSASDPANGTVVITGAGSGLTYAPDANYCDDRCDPRRHLHLHAERRLDRHRLSRVACVDDNPMAVNNSATRAEDSAAAAIDVLTNSRSNSGPKTISSASDPANGTVVLTGGTTGAHTGLTYRPDTNYCNDPPDPYDTFTYTLNGDSTATVAVAVTCADDPPVAVDDTATVVEDEPATAIDVLGNDTDVDGGPMTIESVTDPGTAP